MKRRHIPVIFYTYEIGDTEYIDDMGRDPKSMSRFYRQLKKGNIPSTSQINTTTYYEYFEPLVQKGDLLHIAFGSGMTESVFNAEAAADMLRAQYPDRRIVVIDSLCSSSGYGMLVDGAADLRDRGQTVDETATWVTANRKCIHHQFFSTDLSYYRKSGRMSGPTATLGTVLGICPVMRLDDTGSIKAYDKVRGEKAAIARTIKVMQAHARGGSDYSWKCFICHSNCLIPAMRLKEAVLERFHNIQEEVRVCDIGTIIASHCGPGTVAVFFLGDERAPDPLPKLNTY